MSTYFVIKIKNKNNHHIYSHGRENRIYSLLKSCSTSIFKNFILLTYLWGKCAHMGLRLGWEGSGIKAVSGTMFHFFFFCVHWWGRRGNHPLQSNHISTRVSHFMMPWLGSVAAWISQACPNPILAFVCASRGCGLLCLTDIDRIFFPKMSYNHLFSFIYIVAT